MHLKKTGRNSFHESRQITTKTHDQTCACRFRSSSSIIRSSAFSSCCVVRASSVLSLYESSTISRTFSSKSLKLEICVSIRRLSMHRLSSSTCCVLGFDFGLLMSASICSSIVSDKRSRWNHALTSRTESSDGS